MSAGSVPCPECGKPVPADRDACPACGALMAAPAAPDAMVAADGLASGGIVPGGFVPSGHLPPSTIHRPAPEAAPAPRMPLAGSPLVPPAAMAEPSAAAGSPGARTQPGRASLLADLPFDAPDTLAEWLVAVGSGVAAVTFLLPWAPRIVNYTSSWGLASVSHLPVLGLLVTTAVLAILPNRVATWVRSGVLGLISGSLFLGVLWPYVAGDFGAEFGSIAGSVAALVLIAGGVLAVAPRKGRADLP